MLEERRGLWKRYLVGAVLVLLASASATGVAAFHEIDKVVNAFKHGNTISLPNELAQADNGKPQTVLLIGADQRAPGAADYRAGARSDTMMLVRLDPSKRATALMSVPRDLKVHIPGHGVDMRLPVTSVACISSSTFCSAVWGANSCPFMMSPCLV